MNNCINGLKDKNSSGIKFLQDHECEDLKNETKIYIEQYRCQTKDRWFFNIENKLYELRYCPFCGQKLGDSNGLDN